MKNPQSPASSPSPSGVSRRSFIKTASAAGAVSAIGFPAFLRGQNLNSAVQYAAIGNDGKGWSDIKEMAYHMKIKPVAFCDVDSTRQAQAHQLAPDAALYQDAREMFDKMGDKIDAVTVSTPDHMHAYLALMAMRAGKHVYCQKPLTHTVWEARQLKKQAAKSGVITRMGNQIHSHAFYRTAVRLIQEGAIGKVKEVHSWVKTTGHGRSALLDRPDKNDPVPDTLNWDAWIGVAAMRPYGGNRVYHPYCWRDWQEFGSGAIGDFGCHIFDPVFTALKINHAPTSVRSVHTGINDEVWPAQQTIYYEYGGTEYTAADKLKITWCDGGLLPGVNLGKTTDGEPLPRSGSVFIGESGNMVLPHVGQPILYPREKQNNDYPMEDALNHYHGWVDGIVDGKQPSDGFDYGTLLTEVSQLGNLSNHFLNETLEWDAENLKFPNKPEADKYLTKDYREGWEIEEVLL